jgi:hypothetical protein
MAKKTSNPTRVYLAFPDGVYHYECRQCDALCCRGQGFGGSLKKEMAQLLKLYPALAHAAVSRDGDIVNFATPTGACHFLESDNLCRIEKEHGKNLKPGVCSLFPFNSFIRFGSILVVSPHFMCPLRLQTPAQPGLVAGTHSTIHQAVLGSGLVELDQCAENHPQAGNEKTLLQREEGFRDACGSAIGRLRFRDLLRSQSLDGEALGVFVKRATAIYGLEAPSADAPRDGVDDLLLALASPLRAKMLALESEEVLRFLALAEAILRQMIYLSSRPPTLQGSHKIIASAGSALRLLARGDSPLGLPPQEDTLALKFANPDLTLAAFAAMEEIQASIGVLTALENSISPSLSAADRAIFLLQLGHKLEFEAAEAKKRATKANATGNGSSSHGRPRARSRRGRRRGAAGIDALVTKQ